LTPPDPDTLGALPQTPGEREGRELRGRREGKEGGEGEERREREEETGSEGGKGGEGIIHLLLPQAHTVVAAYDGNALEFLQTVLEIVLFVTYHACYLCANAPTLYKLKPTEVEFLYTVSL